MILRYLYNDVHDDFGNYIETIRCGEVRAGIDGDYIIWYA